MSTRSLIGAEQQDGSVKFVYCHWDGYPNNNGDILRQHFTDRTKVEELIALGSISALGKEIGEKHDFDEPHEKHPDWCRFYGRDRGEKNVETQTAKSALEFVKEDQGTEFWYLFTKDGKWMFCDGEKKLKRLTARACGVTSVALSQPVTVIDGGSRHRTRTKKE